MAESEGFSAVLRKIRINIEFLLRRLARCKVVVRFFKGSLWQIDG
jgi:hypothetical protein